MAIESNNIEAIKLLLSQKDIDVNKKSFFFSCYIHGSGWGTRGKERTPLFLAIKIKNHEFVKLLLERSDIDVNVLNKIHKNTNFFVVYNHHFKLYF